MKISINVNDDLYEKLKKKADEKKIKITGLTMLLFDKAIKEALESDILEYLK